MIPLIYAHRGASGDAPENTMAAFRLAVGQGAHGIELDIQLTSDGRLVCIHDETLDRTTTGSGLVAGQTYEKLKRYDASYTFPGYYGEPVPLLSDVLEFLAPTSLELNIELKNSIVPYEGMEEKAIRLVREAGMEQRITFSSFNHYSVAKLVRLAPDIAAGILYEANLYEPWCYASAFGASALHPYFYSLSRSIVDSAHRAGMKVRPYTVNEEADLRRMIEWGVDAAITNYPARMKAILAETVR